MKTPTKELPLSEQIERSIQKANKAYQKATPAQRRVLIARDALKQLEAHKIEASCGVYVHSLDLAFEANLKREVQLNTLLHNPTLKSHCTVCARGALLLSAVRYRNDCTILPNGIMSERKWIREFSVEQTFLIESAFEKWEKTKTWLALLSPEEKGSATARLSLILKNIIRNKGTFKITER